MIDYPDHVDGFKANATEKKPCMPMWAIVLVSVLVVAAVGVGIYFMVKGPAKKPEKETTPGASGPELAPETRPQLLGDRPPAVPLNRLPTPKVPSKSAPQQELGWGDWFKMQAVMVPFRCRSWWHSLTSCCKSKPATRKITDIAPGASTDLSQLPLTPDQRALAEKLGPQNKAVLIQLMPMFQAFQNGEAPDTAKAAALLKAMDLAEVQRLVQENSDKLPIPPQMKMALPLLFSEVERMDEAQLKGMLDMFAQPGAAQAMMAQAQAAGMQTP